MSDEKETRVEAQRRGPRSNQKLKILYWAKILLENTDANHDITLQEIIAQLDAFGIKIKKTQYGKTYHYQVINRDFEPAELKLLVDSGYSARCMFPGV